MHLRGSEPGFIWYEAKHLTAGPDSHTALLSFSPDKEELLLSLGRLLGNVSLSEAIVKYIFLSVSQTSVFVSLCDLKADESLTLYKIESQNFFCGH